MNNKGDYPVNDLVKRDEIVNDSDSFVKLADSSIEGPIQYVLVKQKKTTEGLWYACSYCKKDFKKPSDLIRHIRIHTMQKPFKVSRYQIVIIFILLNLNFSVNTVTGGFH